MLYDVIHPKHLFFSKFFLFSLLEVVAIVSDNSVVMSVIELFQLFKPTIFFYLKESIYSTNSFLSFLNGMMSVDAEFQIPTELNFEPLEKYVYTTEISEDDLLNSLEKVTEFFYLPSN